jgi:hypothetical protein
MGAQHRQLIHSLQVISDHNANVTMVKQHSMSTTSKRVRFLDSIVEHVYFPQTAVRASGKELFSLMEKEAGRQGRFQDARQWRSLGTHLLADIHDIPVQERIKRMRQIPAEARGLEKEICSEFRAKSHSTIQKVIQAVLQRQSQLIRANIPVHKHAGIIAQAATDCSHSARCMARIFGLVDQQFVRDEHSRLEKQDISSSSSSSDSTYSTTRFSSERDDEEERHESVYRSASFRRSFSPKRLSKQVLRLTRSVSKKVLKA